MNYLMGAAIIFAALLLIPAFRIFFKRLAGPEPGEAFGAAESVALIATFGFAAGFSVVCAEALAAFSAASAVAATASIAGAIAAIVLVWKALARMTDLSETGAPDLGTPLPGAGAAANQNRRPASLPRAA